MTKRILATLALMVGCSDSMGGETPPDASTDGAIDAAFNPCENLWKGPREPGEVRILGVDWLLPGESYLAANGVDTWSAEAMRPATGEDKIGIYAYRTEMRGCVFQVAVEYRNPATGEP